MSYKYETYISFKIASTVKINTSSQTCNNMGKISSDCLLVRSGILVNVSFHNVIEIKVVHVHVYLAQCRLNPMCMFLL